jgi:hypothetical protein
MGIHGLALESRAQDLLDGVIRVERRILGDKAETKPFPRGARPDTRLFKAGEDPQQRRLARAFGSDETVLVSLEYAKLTALKKRS